MGKTPAVSRRQTTATGRISWEWRAGISGGGVRPSFLLDGVFDLDGVF